MIIIKSDKEIEKMRAAGLLVADCHEMLAKHVKPGITTLELDRIAEEYIRKAGAYPTFLNYQGFAASICSSINGQVVHGIPDGTRLEEGDIISVRGKGRFIYDGVSRQTKKGRLGVRIRKYV